MRQECTGRRATPARDLVACSIEVLLTSRTGAGIRNQSDHGNAIKGDPMLMIYHSTFYEDLN